MARAQRGRRGRAPQPHRRRLSVPLTTPDGRYIVVRGRLWRTANPNLDAAARDVLVGELMAARRAVRSARGNVEALALARTRVDTAKRSLGERGPVWWDDGAPDWNRHLAKNTPYAAWWAEVNREEA